MFIEKPVGKPVKNFRARVKMYDNNVVVVNPMEPRESNRKMIKQKGKSSFYKSEGEKESSYSIHINVDANDPDPVATMQTRPRRMWYSRPPCRAAPRSSENCFAFRAKWVRSSAPITQRSSKCLTASRRMKRKPILLQTKKSLTVYEREEAMYANRWHE